MNKFKLYVGGNEYFEGDGHMLLVGGSGAGKGVNFIIPALLSPALVASGSSVVVLDPKGENLAICGDHLERNGYKIITINPFNILEIERFGSACFNPFSLTSKDDINAPRFCDLIANCLFPDSERKDHWNESARQYISLYLLYMVATEQANFTTLFKWVRLDGLERLGLLEEIQNCRAFDFVISDTARGILGQLTNPNSRSEIDSIFSTIRRGTDIFKDLQLRKHLTKSDFNLTYLAKEKTALFVCVNPSELLEFGAWLRIFFGCMLRTLQKHYNPHRRVLMVMDEFPQMGRLKEFEMAVAYMRGYNVSLWAVIQDLGQLKRLYWQSWESFLGSASVKMWLPLGADNFTIDYLESRLPIIKKEGLRTGQYYEHREKELTKYELIISDELFLERRGFPMKRIKKIPYWQLDWANNASPNPFREGIV
jgi:type IV secretion system protein VirD4